MIRPLLKFCALAALAAFASGCRALPERSSSSVRAARPPALDFASITAPAIGRHVHREIVDLDQIRDEPAARLRRAFLLGQVARDEDAMTELNSLLYSDLEPGPNVEAFARYLRAESFARAGEHERARDERELALARALDPALRSRIESDLRASAPRPAPTRSVDILPRAAWNARRAQRMDPMGKVRRVTIHHSGVLTRDRSRQAAIAALSAFQRQHQDRNGWSDIGYHYLIDGGGRIWEGRSAKWQGAHAGDPAKNRGNIGVCLLGNFIDGGQRPNAAQQRALLSLVEWLQRRHGFGDSGILTHQELKVTECPGRHLQAVVERMRRRSTAAAVAR